METENKVRAQEGQQNISAAKQHRSDLGKGEKKPPQTKRRCGESGGSDQGRNHGLRLDRNQAQQKRARLALESLVENRRAREKPGAGQYHEIVYAEVLKNGGHD